MDLDWNNGRRHCARPVLPDGGCTGPQLSELRIAASQPAQTEIPETAAVGRLDVSRLRMRGRPAWKAGGRQPGRLATADRTAAAPGRKAPRNTSAPCFRLLSHRSLGPPLRAVGRSGSPPDDPFLGRSPRTAVCAAGEELPGSRRRPLGAEPAWRMHSPMPSCPKPEGRQGMGVAWVSAYRGREFVASKRLPRD